MILERLVLENFRQFKGRQEIVFSDLRERNVTLVHAENGFGKTTLLNAITWVLYGRDGLSEDFEKPDSLIHEGLAHYCKDPHGLEASVSLTFTHDDERFVLTRALTLAEQQHDARRARLSMEAMRDGQTFNLDNPQRRVNSIIPDGIAKFLFFNGERIDHLAMEKNSDQVTAAIRQMLGLRLLERTIDDLKHQNVRGKLLKELKENTSDEKRDLIAELERQEERKRRFEETIVQCRANVVAIDQEVDAIDKKLNANRAAHEQQARRMRLQKERDELKAKREELTKRLSRLIAEDGYTLFTGELVKRGGSIMSDLRQRNMIPAPVIDSYLQQLLDDGQCICDRHLPKGSPEYAAVAKRLSSAPNQDFNNAVSALDHAIGLLEGVSVQTRENLKQLNAERLELNRRLRELEEEIAEIHQIIGNKNDEEAQSLEEARRLQLLKRDDEQAKLGRTEGDLESAKAAIASLNSQVQQISDQEEVAARAQRRVDAVDESIRVLEEILAAETDELRPILNDEIATHFAKIIDREYWAVLTPDYRLRIRKRVPGNEEGEDVAEIDVALSTGQRQVTSLVFIASLLALARRRSEIPTIVKGLSGSEYPLVTDSPFGQLSIFGPGVAKWVPDLAPQVALLVSPKQYDGNVAMALSQTGRINKRYYLVYFGPTLPANAATHIVIDGVPYQQYFEYWEERTELREIES
jgi:DNA sulfur modification protein DndD